MSCFAVLFIVLNHSVHVANCKYTLNSVNLSIRENRRVKLWVMIITSAKVLHTQVRGPRLWPLYVQLSYTDVENGPEDTGRGKGKLG